MSITAMSGMESSEIGEKSVRKSKFLLVKNLIISPS
jgi:hypothetical protein